MLDELLEEFENDLVHTFATILLEQLASKEIMELESPENLIPNLEKSINFHIDKSMGNLYGQIKELIEKIRIQTLSMLEDYKE